MIKNIIFDVGLVLVEYSWQKVFHGLGFTGELYERVADATVRSPMWNEYDRSALSDEEILNGFISYAPDLEREIRQVWEHNGDMITCYPYTRDWILECKEKGLGCYVLSNYPRRTYELTSKELSFLDDMDGGLFSFQVRLIKPEPEIFGALMERYGLKPGECVFLDDNRGNIEAAGEFGLHTILFQNREQADSELRERMEP